MDCMICNHGKMEVAGKRVDAGTAQEFCMLRLFEGPESLAIVHVDERLAALLRAELDKLFPPAVSNPAVVDLAATPAGVVPH